MANGQKFYIYGGSRWREVDLSDGRVEGWGRARFVYPRRGKVQVAKTRAVLAALRDLSAGQNSAVKDGEHLLSKKIEKVKVKNLKDQELHYDDSHCCHHSNNNGCKPSKKIKAAPRVSAVTQCVPKADVAIQTSQTLTYPDTFNQQNSRKRRRETSSSDENLPTKITTTATIHTKTSKKVPSLKLEKADSANYNIYKRRRSKSSDSIVWVVLPKNKRIDEEGNKESKILKSSSKPLSWKSKSKKLKTSEDITVTNDKQSGTQRSIVTCDELDIIQLSSSNFNSQGTLSNVKYATGRDQCKELIIDENDIQVLRNYLLNHATDFDLLKFDQDDDYKKLFFFKINPLVSIERSIIIARMLHTQSRSEISLIDFASQLGLRSVSDQLSQQSRYRMRKRNTIDKESDSEIDKENLELKNKPKGKLVKNGKSNFAKAKMSEEYSTDSDFESDQEFRDRQIKRTNRLLSESNRKGNRDEHKTSSKPYKTKNSIENKRYVESSDSNKGNKSNYIKNTENLPKESNKKGGQNEVVEIISPNNKRKSRSERKKDVTIVTDSDSKVETSQRSNRKGKNKVINNLDLTYSTSEDETLIIPEKLRRNKNIIKANKKNIDSSEDTSVEDEPKLAKRPNKGIKNKPNYKNNNLDLTQTTSEEETVELPTRKARTSRTIDKRIYLDLADSNEDSELDEPKSTRELRRDKSKISNLIKHDLNLMHTTSEEETPKNLSKDAQRQNNVKSNDIVKNTDLNEEDTEGEESKSAKGKQLKNNNKLNKVRKHRGIKKDNVNARKNIADSTSDSDVKTPKQSDKKGNNKIDRSKNETKSTNENNSKAEGPKSKESNRGPKNNNRRKNLDDSTSDSDVKTPKQSNKKGNNKIDRSKNESNRRPKNNNTRMNIDDSTSDSDAETHKESNRREKTKINTSKNINKRTTGDNSEDFALTKDKESHKPSKETKNRINNSKTVKNRKDSNEDNSKETFKPVKAKNKEDSRSSKENKRGQKRHNATTDTVEFSSDEKEVFLKKRSALKNDSQESKPTTGKATNSISKRPLSSIRPYSNLEDHAIVTWVSTGGRACCVNGNRIWRELQMEYAKIAGQARTWHSLRNRYLRYILPSLGSMALPISHVGRLRAAAATGVIKSRKRTANERRNSIFELPTRGALSRRPVASRSLSTDSEPPPPPKRHKHDHTRERKRAKSPSPSPKRLLRSSLTSSPLQTLHSPRYSDITRRFANNHRQDESTPTASPTTKQSSENSSETKKLPVRNTSASKKSSAAKLSTSLRRSFRNKESPVKETDKSTETQRTRTKLFNPGSLF